MSQDEYQATVLWAGELTPRGRVTGTFTGLSEPDPLDELLEAAGVDKAKVPTHWHAIQRARTFEDQQQKTRQQLAAYMSSDDYEPGDSEMEIEEASSQGDDYDQAVANYSMQGYAVPRSQDWFTRYVNQMMSEPPGPSDDDRLHQIGLVAPGDEPWHTIDQRGRALLHGPTTVEDYVRSQGWVQFKGLNS